MITIARPIKFIPENDIKGLRTLINEGLTQTEIEEYYKKHNIDVDQATISRRLQKLSKK